MSAPALLRPRYVSCAPTDARTGSGNGARNVARLSQRAHSGSDRTAAAGPWVASNTCSTGLRRSESARASNWSWCVSACLWRKPDDRSDASHEGKLARLVTPFRSDVGTEAPYAS